MKMTHKHGCPCPAVSRLTVTFLQNIHIAHAMPSGHYHEVSVETPTASCTLKELTSCWAVDLYQSYRDEMGFPAVRR
jgi:hypothetical protein